MFSSKSLEQKISNSSSFFNKAQSGIVTQLSDYYKTASYALNPFGSLYKANRMISRYIDILQQCKTALEMQQAIENLVKEHEDINYSEVVEIGLYAKRYCINPTLEEVVLKVAHTAKRDMKVA